MQGDWDTGATSRLCPQMLDIKKLTRYLSKPPLANSTNSQEGYAYICMCACAPRSSRISGSQQTTSGYPSDCSLFFLSLSLYLSFSPPCHRTTADAREQTKQETGTNCSGKRCHVPTHTHIPPQLPTFPPPLSLSLSLSPLA